MSELSNEPKPPRERWTLDPGELEDWLREHAPDEDTRYAVQLAQLSQMGSGIDLRQLGIQPEDFDRAELALERAGLEVHEGLEITAPAPVLERLSEIFRNAGISVQTVPISPSPETSPKVVALINHLRAEALRKDGKLQRSNVRVKEIIVIDKLKLSQ